MTKKDIWRYVIVFFITLAVFLFAIWITNFINNKKLENIKTIQDKISIDIISSETQFQLLQGISCKNISASTLSAELNELAEKISFSEENIKDEENIKELKKYYSILQIKDYLLSQKITERCNVNVVPVLYFYTTIENCSNCLKQSAVLGKLREEYPEIRIYSFDYSLNLSTLNTLKNIYNISDKKLPALFIKDNLYTGFKTKEEILDIIPELNLWKKQKLDLEKKKILEIEKQKKENKK